MVLQYILVVMYLVATPGAVYQFIIAFASWPAYIFFLLIGIGVLILRQREPTLTRPYKAYSSKLKRHSMIYHQLWLNSECSDNRFCCYLYHLLDLRNIVCFRTGA
jgi:amino acid transporter